MAVASSPIGIYVAPNFIFLVFLVFFPMHFSKLQLLQNSSLVVPFVCVFGYGRELHHIFMLISVSALGMQ